MEKSREKIKVSFVGCADEETEDTAIFRVFDLLLSGDLDRADIETKNVMKKVIKTYD